MKRLDNNTIPTDNKEVRLVTVGFNAANRIKDFINHYKSIGVDRIFYVDNNSSDNTLEILKEYDNVHVWLQEEKYGKPNKFGVSWMEEVLSEYGVGNWCLTVDVDELFVYPQYEYMDIKQFITKQESHGFDSVKALFIDMYSDKKLKDTKLNTDTPLIEVCKYFDTSYPGVRSRVMGMSCWLQKQPLFLCKENTMIAPGMHFIHGVSKISDVYCNLLHLKFFDDFVDYINNVKENLDANDVKYYKMINEDSIFYDVKLSSEYKGSKTLIDLGLMSNRQGTNVLQDAFIEQGDIIDDFFKNES